LRPRLILLLLAALAAALVLAPAASADLFTPESGPTQNAQDIDTLYKITLYVGIVIFLLVECVLVYSLIKFRARRGGPEAAQIRSDLRAARAIGMHWGTFENLTDEPLDEPPALLAAQRAQAGLAPDEFDVMKIGETRRIIPTRQGEKR